MHASVCAPATTSRPTPRPDNTVSRVVPSKAVAVVLLDERLGVSRSKLRDDPPLVAPSRELLVGVLDPDDGDLFAPRLVDKAGDVRDDRVALMRRPDDAVLHVDDNKRGVRPFLECGHGFPLTHVGALRLDAEYRGWAAPR